MGCDACKWYTSVLQANKRFGHPDKESNGQYFIVLDYQGATTSYDSLQLLWEGALACFHMTLRF